MSKMINALSAALITSIAYITLPSNAIATSYLCEAELTSIDSVNGSVKVYSNGADQGTWNSCKSENGIFGYEYQCTELADRYFNYNFPSTFGRDYFLNALNLGFAPLKNRESPILPKHGDAIGFDNRTATDQTAVGHITLVDTVTQNPDGTYTVEIVEQNWGSPTSSNTGRAQLKMTRSAQGAYQIDDRGSGFTTQGWVRLFGYQMIVPGEYQGPSWRNPQSYAFLDAYEQSGGRAAMGDVDIRMGETPYVHDWCVQTKCVIIQDFFGGTYGDSAIIFNAWLDKAFIIRGAFWEFYRTHDGPIALGSPIENEHAPVPNQTYIHPCSSNAFSCQGFQRGSLYWDGKSVIPISNPLPMSPINIRIQ